MEEVKVSFYKVKSCGYYPRGNHKNPKFGGLDEILADLGRWGAGKKLGHTKTFQPNDGGNLLPVYLVDVTQSGDAWLLRLWNEVANTDGKVASINGEAPVGRAEVAETEVEEGHIPGHATYFWILPGEGLIASVRFQHPTAGFYGLAKYMRSFVTRFTSYVAWGDPNQAGQRDILGYRANPNDVPEFLRARFQAEVFVKPGPLELIVKNAANIRKLKKRAKLDLTIRAERSLFQRLLVGMHLANHRTVQQEATMNYEVSVQGLQQDEVREIVASWNDEDGDDTDYGFVFHGDAQTHWLGKEYVRETLALEVERDNTELVRPDSLLRELARHKQYLLGRLN